VERPTLSPGLGRERACAAASQAGLRPGECGCNAGPLEANSPEPQVLCANLRTPRG
jgi:hypothetical protein